MAQEIETRRLNEDFGVELEELVEFVEAYRNRKFDEDLIMLRQKFEGTEGLAQKLRTRLKDGLRGDDFEDRDAEFGSNK